MLFLILVAQASAAPSVVVTGIRTTPEFVIYSVTIKDWSVTDKAPTACSAYISVYCYVFVALVVEDGRAMVSNNDDWKVRMKTYGLTTGELLSQLNEVGFRIPMQTTISSSIKNNQKPSDCVALYAGTNAASGAHLISSCTLVGQAPVKCDINGNTTIDHKTLVEDKLDGAQTSTQLNLKCTGETSVVVKADRTNSYGVRLRSNDSLYSEVKVNGKDATGGITVPVTNNVSTPLTITSTLKTRGSVAPGPFSGSTVITVSPN